MLTSRWINVIKSRCASVIPISDQISVRLHETKQSSKRAAVLIPLCNWNGKASILFNLRSNEVSTHKGQVSFPGGHLNVDETPIDAAVRETYEELGRAIGNLQVLGTCQTLPAITGTLVTPILAFM